MTPSQNPLSRERSTAQSASAWMVRVMGEDSFLFVLAVVVGLGGGLGAVAFRWLIDNLSHLFLVRLAGLLGSPWLLPLVPALGGLIVGVLVLRWAREAKGHGVPEVMAAVATQGGRIRARVAVVKALASAVCIGSGGSVGREGPIVQIGSALGSMVGQVFSLGPQRMRILVGCGAAAGISATFNAPLAGVVFSLEVILGDFSIAAFSPIIISSVLATALARTLEGNTAAFTVPHYQSLSPYELILYAILGVIAALIAAAFTRVLYWSEDRFDEVPVSEYAKPVIGGAMVGIIGLWLPQVFGVGYETITATLLNQNDILLLGMLLIFKVVATCITLGSGGSGGVFAPSLFIGAMIGGLFGNGVAYLFPGQVHPGAFALVGMAAMVAGTTHAPLTAMLILFEMTDDYKLILPLMLATTISTLVSKLVSAESIYTLKLSRRGLRLAHGINVSLLESLRVSEVVNTEYESVKPAATLNDIIHLLQSSNSNDFPVVDASGDILGMINFDDIRTVISNQDVARLVIAADAMNADPPCIRADASLREAQQMLTENDVETLPVVSGNRRLIGLLRRSDLMSHYNNELQRRAKG